VEALEGALDERGELGAPAGEHHRLDEADEGGGSGGRRDDGAHVALGRPGAGAGMLDRGRRAQRAAAGGLHEQRLLRAEVVGDLAREGAGPARDLRHRDVPQPALVEQLARRVEQLRAPLPAGEARAAGGVRGLDGHDSTLTSPV
jgi:hypothetical protein